MKTLLLLGVFLINWSIYSQSYYQVITPDVAAELNEVFLINEQEGWIVGSKGILLHTTNGGVSWVRKNTGFNYDFLKIFFYDSNHGWIGTGNGKILITADGGINWTESLISADFTYFDAIYFTSPNTGHISVGKYKAVYIMKTTDGGLTWEKKDSLVSATTASRWYAIDFYNENLGVVVGDKKDAQRYTTNGGSTWLKSTPINDAFFRDQRAVKWLSPTDVISLGEGNEFWGVVTPIYKSTDGGINWIKKTQFPQNNYDRVRGVYFKNSSEGIAVGSNGFSLAYISRTTDGGETWYASFLTYSFGLKAIAGYNDKLIVIGTGAHILSSDDYGNSWNLYRWFTPNPIYSINFTETKGYVVTRYSDLYKSDDIVGNIWYYKSSPPMWESYSMHFINDNTGFILKENRHIVKTTDGGETWRTVLDPVPFNARNRVGGITFPSASIGYAWMSINDYGEYYIYKTTNGGENWFQISSLNGPGYISGKIAFFDENTGIIAGPQRWMMRTTNGGADWDTVSNYINFPAHLTKKDFKDIFIVNANKAWVAGLGYICVTTDKGISWRYVEHQLNNIDSSFYTIAFFNDTLGYVATYSGLILKTTDSGFSWIADSSLINQFTIFSSAFNNNGRIFFGTINGYLIASELISSVKEKDETVERFELYQNYPNPFNSTTKIRFSISTLSNEDKIPVTLEVFDLLGRKITSIVNDYLNPGTYEVEFSVDKIDDRSNSTQSSGILFYKLSAGDQVMSKKMIYLK